MRKQSQLKLQNNNNKGRSRSTSLLGGGRTVDPGSFDPPGAFCRGMVKTKGKWSLPCSLMMKNSQLLLLLVPGGNEQERFLALDPRAS